jgi:hypothetical protein
MFFLNIKRCKGADFWSRPLGLDFVENQRESHYYDGGEQDSEEAISG